jgi:hypothetical protein
LVDVPGTLATKIPIERYYFDVLGVVRERWPVVLSQWTRFSSMSLWFGCSNCRQPDHPGMFYDLAVHAIWRRSAHSRLQLTAVRENAGVAKQHTQADGSHAACNPVKQITQSGGFDAES